MIAPQALQSLLSLRMDIGLCIGTVQTHEAFRGQVLWVGS